MVKLMNQLKRLKHEVSDIFVLIVYHLPFEFSQNNQIY